MNNQIQLRGNLCACGGVWFCYDIPESDPSRCPFCKRDIESGEVYTRENVQEDIYNDDVPENIERGLGKATGQTKVTLVAKVCNFCNNELFFDSEDAIKADNCPYCHGVLIPTDKFDTGIGDRTVQKNPNTLGGINVNELMDCVVAIKFKSVNPWNRLMKYIFKGIDPATKMVKLQGGNEQIFWKHLDSIKSISKI